VTKSEAKPLSPKGSKMTVRPETLDLLRNLTDREHESFNARTSTFMLWQSVLLAGYGWGHKTKLLAILVPAMGLVSTLMWIHVAHRTLKVQRYYENLVLSHEKSLDEDERVYTTSRTWRRENDPPFGHLTTSKYFAYGFPFLWLLAWFVLLVGLSRA